MEISVIIGQMAVLFIIMAAGYAANKIGILSAQADKILSKVVLSIAMPCSILNSVMGGSVGISGAQAAFFVLMSLLTFVIIFAAAIPMSLILPRRGEKSDRGLYAYLIAFGNVAFMGFPVLNSIFGSESAFYVALFNIPFTIIIFSVGIILISGGHGKINAKMLVNAPFAAAIIAVIIFLTGFKTPEIVAEAVSITGGITTPCAMLVIGSTLARVPFKEVFAEWRLYPMTFVKLIIIPVVTWLVLRLIITDGLMLGVLVALSGMPAATTATMMAMEYDGNERLASKGVFITTLLSVVTIPIIVMTLLN